MRRLLSDSKERKAQRQFIIEGPKALSDAITAGAVIEAIFVASDANARVRDLALSHDCDVYMLEPGVIERIAATVSPQGVVAVVGFLDQAFDALQNAGALVVCVGLQDPGNAGTILRTAAGAGINGVVFCHGSVDPYNPKVVRASAGAIFQVPVCIDVSVDEVLTGCNRWGIKRFASFVEGGRDYFDADFTDRFALFVGNEGSGLREDLRSQVDEVMTIPMAPGTDSLNVAMAATVICFEAARQRAMR